MGWADPNLPTRMNGSRCMHGETLERLILLVATIVASNFLVMIVKGTLQILDKGFQQIIMPSS